MSLHLGSASAFSINLIYLLVLLTVRSATQNTHIIRFLLSTYTCHCSYNTYMTDFFSLDSYFLIFFEKNKIGVSV